MPCYSFLSFFFPLFPIPSISQLSCLPLIDFIDFSSLCAIANSILLSLFYRSLSFLGFRHCHLFSQLSTSLVSVLAHVYSSFFTHCFMSLNHPNHVLNIASYLFMFLSRLYCHIYSLQSDSLYNPWGLTQGACVYNMFCAPCILQTFSRRFGKKKIDKAAQVQTTIWVCTLKSQAKERRTW